MISEEIISSVVKNVAGQDVLPLIDVLKGKKNVSEFTLAEELKEEINTIRNKLYRLYDSNLVEFTRKKDKKKGWYIYYWTFVPSRIPFILKEMKRKKLEKLRERLATEQGSNFFVCNNECMRLTFDKAVDYQFKCPECGSLMNQEDNARKIDHMLKEIEMLEQELQHKVVVAVPVKELEVLSKKAELKVVHSEMKVKHVKKIVKKKK